MKRYLSLVKPKLKVLDKPCRIIFDGQEYTSFCNTFSIALTTENCDGFEMSDADRIHLKATTQGISYEGVKKKINFNDIRNIAKEKGYRLNKVECSDDFTFLLKFDDAYFKLGLVDAAYSIIDEGDECIIYHADGERNPLVMNTRIGVCAIMPVIRVNEDDPDRMIIDI